MTTLSNIKRTLTILGLAGAAMALAPTAAQAADTPGADAVGQVMELTDNPAETLEQAQLATAAGDEAIGTAVTGSAPALAGPLTAVADSAGLA
ncbi:hypothetical protein ACWCQL_22840 [Streptomyces sp. NPDC002073]|uniref:hypothetical protein n=1 Tax=Streptomyces sp. NBC_00239 TaxID=2903640 RepID=UPI002E2E4AF1|nr:hypothetical protein [Streptomyces sp. NBC_00239]